MSTAPCFLAGHPTHFSILPSTVASVAAVPLLSASPLQPTTTLSLQAMAPVPMSGMPPSSDAANTGMSSQHTPVVLPSQEFGVPGPPAAPGLSLSLSAEPIPARLVQKIRSGQFVKMRELLGDIIALTQHFESLAG
uniref:Uncharacterized protein n=1 Tax=Amphimedon queenslandica TaxID=400682 RepID=A0A1X7VFI7_AMPQE